MKLKKRHQSPRIEPDYSQPRINVNNLINSTKIIVVTFSSFLSFSSWIASFEVRHLPPLETFCLPTSDFLLFVGVETFTSALIRLLIWRSVTQVAGFVDLYVIWEDFWREDYGEILIEIVFSFLWFFSYFKNIYRYFDCDFSSSFLVVFVWLTSVSLTP